jgi:hypothetical protein
MNIKVVGPLGLNSIEPSNYPPDQDMTVSIYTLSGQLLKSYVVRSDANGMLSQLHLNENQLPSGVYLYTVHGKNSPKIKMQLFIQK